MERTGQEPNTSGNNSISTTRYQCYICDRYFKLAISLDSHLLLHATGSVFECAVCQTRFENRTTLQEHRRSHPPERPFSCGLCKKSFDLEAAVRDHMRCHMKRHRPKKEIVKQVARLLDTYECQPCGKVFKRFASFSCHMLRHRIEKYLECKTCGKWFKTFESYASHCRRGHPYGCTICHRQFTFKSLLTQHLATHTDKYSCRACNRGYANSAQGHGHSIMCIAHRPFCCGVCQKRFITSAGVTNHMTKHFTDKITEKSLAQGEDQKQNKSIDTTKERKRSKKFKTCAPEKEKSTAKRHVREKCDISDTKSLANHSLTKEKSETVDISKNRVEEAVICGAVYHENTPI